MCSLSEQNAGCKDGAPARVNYTVENYGPDMDIHTRGMATIHMTLTQSEEVRMNSIGLPHDHEPPLTHGWHVVCATSPASQYTGPVSRLPTTSLELLPVKHGITGQQDSTPCSPFEGLVPVPFTSEPKKDLPKLMFSNGVSNREG
jgi:hypothetical protein